MAGEGRVDRGRATRAGLIAAATRLFAERGYEGVSTDAVLEAARVSRGSLYHHFDAKGSLFEAVLERQEERIRDTVLQVIEGMDDPIAALRAGCSAWLQMARDPVIQRIVLIDAPSVIGWEKWREIDSRNGFGLLKTGIAFAAAQGRIEKEMVDTVAHVLLAALIELAMLIARADEPEAAERVAEKSVDEILNGFLRPERETK